MHNKRFYNYENLTSAVNPGLLTEQFRDITIAVLGDAIVDEYLNGISNQLCREAPVPVISWDSFQFSPGGAANTAINLSKLGAKVHFFTVLGKDRKGKKLIQALNAEGVHTESVLLDTKRSTLCKTRISAGSQMLLRIDKGSVIPIDGMWEEALILRLNEMVPNCDALVISDYSLGTVSCQVIESIIKLQNETKILVGLDAKKLGPYAGTGFFMVKPNYEEAIDILGLTAQEGEKRIAQIHEQGNELLDKMKSKIIAVTLDSDGAIIFNKDHTPYRTYSRALEYPNSTGAGDTFISAMMLALTVGADPSVASEIASIASAIAIGKKKRTVSCSWMELKGYCSRDQKEVTNFQKLKELSSFYHSEGKKIVFTNGCFDILHRGHIHFLSQSKSLGDILIVGVNSDESIKKLKEEPRPINRLEDRIKILCSLSCVDHVAGFEGLAPLEMIEVIKPHLYVKGGNHDVQKLPEVPVVKQMGGKICILPYLEQYSTPEIIQRSWARENPSKCLERK